MVQSKIEALFQKEAFLIPFLPQSRGPFQNDLRVPNFAYSSYLPSTRRGGEGRQGKCSSERDMYE